LKNDFDILTALGTGMGALMKGANMKDAANEMLNPGAAAPAPVFVCPANMVQTLVSASTSTAIGDPRLRRGVTGPRVFNSAHRK
jgi:hypothetical protein